MNYKLLISFILIFFFFESILLSKDKKYEKLYDKCIVLIEVGSFFEAYGIDDEKEKIGHAKILSDTLNIVITRKDKKKYIEIGYNTTKELLPKITPSSLNPNNFYKFGQAN